MMINLTLSQWAKKSSLKEYVFANSALKYSCCCQKYTSTDCYFGD